MRVLPNASSHPPGLMTRSASRAHASHHAWNARLPLMLVS